jgi:hypothetical protein
MSYNDRTSPVSQDPSPEIISGPTKTRRKTQAAEQTYCPKQSTKLKVELIDLQYEIMANPELDPSMKAGALAVVLAIARPMKTTGLCSWPSQDTIAGISGLSKPYVGKICEMLDACGYISTLPGRAGRGHSARYRFSGTWDEDARPDTVKGNPNDLLAGHSVQIKGSHVYQNSKKKKKERISPLNPTYAVETADSGPPILAGAAPGVAADTVSAGLMLNPALTSDIEVLVPEPREAAAASSMRPAFETCIPDTKSAPTERRLDSNCFKEDQRTTSALEAASMPIRIAVANAANVTPIDRSGQAARRPEETRPHHKGSTTMSRIAKNEPRPELFAQVKRWYPEQFVGGDDQLSFEAFELCLDHGVEFEELIAGAFDRMADADDGRDVPPLLEFLVSKCWVEAIAA